MNLEHRWRGIRSFKFERKEKDLCLIGMKKSGTEEILRIIEMAWEDRTPFEAIQIQFGLKENDVREIMRREMKSSSFKMWHKRVSGRKTKHLALRSREINRFKSKNQ